MQFVSWVAKASEIDMKDILIFDHSKTGRRKGVLAELTNELAASGVRVVAEETGSSAKLWLVHPSPENIHSFSRENMLAKAKSNPSVNILLTSSHPDGLDIPAGMSANIAIYPRPLAHLTTDLIIEINDSVQSGESIDAVVNRLFKSLEPVLALYLIHCSGMASDAAIEDTLKRLTQEAFDVLRARKSPQANKLNEEPNEVMAALQATIRQEFPRLVDL